MSPDSWLGLVLLLAAVVLLAVATAAETGVVFISRTRVHAFASKGMPRAAALDAYIRERHALLGTLAIARDVAVVLGISVGTFLVVRETGDTWVALAVTMGCAVLVIAVIEALSRLIVARSPERWGLRLVPAMRAFQLVFGVPARLLDMIASGALGAGESQEAEDDDDLLRLVELHEGNGGAENGELEMIRRIAGMVDRPAREIMVPRIDIVAVDTEATVEGTLALIVEKGYSRIPLYEETIDNIVGVVYAKDLLPFFASGRQPASLREIARPPYVVPEGKHIQELLTELRANKVHMAIVVDEYGGTAGLVTIEDVLEEIVGEIQDEYDREEATVQRVSDSEAVFDARVSIDALNEMFDLDIEGEDFDTVGGFVYHELGRMPAPGDEVHAEGVTLRVISVQGRRIRKVRATRRAVEDSAQRQETA